MIPSLSDAINPSRHMASDEVSLSAFRELTVKREHNKGTLVLDGDGLKCVNNHFLKRWNNFSSSVTMESANALRLRFEQVVNDTLDEAFDELKRVYANGDKADALDSDEIQTKFNAVKDAFHKAIFPADYDKKLIVFKRSDIGAIVRNLDQLTPNMTLERLQAMSPEELTHLATNQAAADKANTFGNISREDRERASQQKNAEKASAQRAKAIEANKTFSADVDKLISKLDTVQISEKNVAKLRSAIESQLKGISPKIRKMDEQLRTFMREAYTPSNYSDVWKVVSGAITDEDYDSIAVEKFGCKKEDKGKIQKEMTDRFPSYYPSLVLVGNDEENLELAANYLASLLLKSIGNSRKDFNNTIKNCYPSLSLERNKPTNDELAGLGGQEKRDKIIEKSGLVLSFTKNTEGKMDTAAVLKDVKAFLRDYANDGNSLHLKLGISSYPPPSNEAKLGNVEAFVNAILAAAE